MNAPGWQTASAEISPCASVSTAHAAHDCELVEPEHGKSPMAWTAEVAARRTAARERMRDDMIAFVACVGLGKRWESGRLGEGLGGLIRGLWAGFDSEKTWEVSVLGACVVCSSKEGGEREEVMFRREREDAARSVDDDRARA